MKEELNTLANLASLRAFKKLDNLNVDLTPVTDKLELIEQKLENILVSMPGLNFSKLTINSPTFQLGQNTGWWAEPSGLTNIFDGNENTSTNLFGSNSAQYQECWVFIFPNMTIPLYTKVTIKMGVINTNNRESLFEWAYGTGLGERTIFWSEFRTRSATETIINIEAFIPQTWEWLRFGMREMITWPPRAKIYSVDVWAIS